MQEAWRIAWDWAEGSAVKKFRLTEPKRFIAIQKPNWVCHLIFFFISRRPQLSMSYTIPGECYLCLQGLLFRYSREKYAVFIQDRRHPYVNLHHQKESVVLALFACHTLSISSSRNLGFAKFLFLSIFHTLSHFLLQNSYFLWDCLNFLSSISYALPLFQTPSFCHSNHFFLPPNLPSLLSSLWN